MCSTGIAGAALMLLIHSTCLLLNLMSLAVQEIKLKKITENLRIQMLPKVQSEAYFKTKYVKLKTFFNIIFCIYSISRHYLHQRR